MRPARTTVSPEENSHSSITSSTHTRHLVLPPLSQSRRTHVRIAATTEHGNGHEQLGIAKPLNLDDDGWHPGSNECEPLLRLSKHRPRCRL